MPDKRAELVMFRKVYTERPPTCACVVLKKNERMIKMSKGDLFTIKFGYLLGT